MIISDLRMIIHRTMVKLWEGLNNSYLICLNSYKMHHIKYKLQPRTFMSLVLISLLCFKSTYFFKESCKLEVVSRLIYVTKTKNSMSYQ